MSDNFRAVASFRNSCSDYNLTFTTNSTTPIASRGTSVKSATSRLALYSAAQPSEARTFGRNNNTTPAYAR
ncbi:hypothetical protein SNOG_06863 [Parastagonospora nodorum SN15]|uniref:Uncharacterized protein n=1 Tax=Phaeosphaeria nodorum (strain SN15 / ATCC MYA-4574 / FGSC 10173) TaxID=321614 RepID=Q0UN01_PHANO|nr:hypothetical protein SNOG_06863 [Parastagonospora nodorum SN15]EAT85514.1 hypothetical protein SNOG_06863 [Parastagonospora nodorum SN15]